MNLTAYLIINLTDFRQAKIKMREVMYHKNMNISYLVDMYRQKGKIKVQGVPQSQTAALPRHQEEEETDKSKQAQIEQTYEKH